MKHWITILTAILVNWAANGKVFADVSVKFSSDTLYLCLGEPFVLEASVSGAIGTTSYLWNTGDTTPTLAIVPVQNSGLYHLTVTDILGTTATDTVWVIALPECVWPGDAEGDGFANNYDVLTLGLAYGAQGLIRPDAHTNWIGQGSPSWSQVFPSGLNYAHSDTDGNGKIDSADFFAIGNNYFLPNTSPGGSPVNEEGFPIYIEFPTGNFQPGDTVTGKIMLGTESIPADSVYGVAFSILYEGELIDSASVIVSYDTSWLGNLHVNMETVDKDFYLNGQLDVGITRTDHAEVSGYGRIADITIMIDDITGKKEGADQISLRIENITLINVSGKKLGVNNSGSQSVILLSGEKWEFGYENTFTVFPNPAEDYVYVETNQPVRPGTQITVRDIQGKLFLQTNIPTENLFKLDISQLPPGVYLIEKQYDSWRETQKLMVK
ncbi:MAG: T9SS type A sorting domain-containing protein [Bacteroidia bacterium]|nr:T9SS type A sorting domain-containing protein [Bacteroidia bacterium]